MCRVQVPPGLDEQRELGPSWAAWLDTLPRLAADLLEEWELSWAGGAWHGFASLVLPVAMVDGGAAALKMTYTGDTESQHEALALTRWGGNGAVRLLRADPRRRALLLERAGPTDLNAARDVDACGVVAGAYARLHVAAPVQLAPVTTYVTAWLDAMEALDRRAPLPRRLVEQALSAGRALSSDPGSTGRMIHGDLHYDNVLRAERAPWLVIDPKPMSGDPHYEPAPMLWNRWEDLVASGDVRAAVRRRFHTLVDVAELDEVRARDWATVRLVLNAHWSIEDARRADRGLSADERTWITRCVTIVKAIAD